MDKAYSPHDIERRLYERWEQSGYFSPSGRGEPYCIQLPPPNVTGTLHMGHAFQQTLMDALVRYHRMRGFNTNWVVGTDHAGIATQIVVERQLQAEGKTRHDFGREQFIERVWDWKQQSGSTITRQMRRLGDSANWTYADTEGQAAGYFTMDAKMSRAVTEVFVRLHEQGLIYRGKRLVNWDPVLGTAVSDLEVESEEEEGKIWEIRYPLEDGSGSLVVATTRPETLLGDVAVAVNPQDERYKDFVGKRLKLPLTDRTIPVIADDYVDREFGTGCVKITPAHDFNDYQVWNKHKDKELRNALHGGLIGIFTLDAKLKSSEFDDVSWGHRAARGKVTFSDDDGNVGAATFQLIPKPYRGLDRFEARKHIVADLQTQGLLVAEKPYKLRVPRSGRTNAIVEPMLTDQWFVDLTRRGGGWDTLTKPALDAVVHGDVKFFPEHWAATYKHWLENIHDWCISRQLWWGHQIPAWYGPAMFPHPSNDPQKFVTQTVFVGPNEDDVLAQAKQHYNADHLGLNIEIGNNLDEMKASVSDIASGRSKTIKLYRDPDVLDTWFSSALVPFSSLGWPEQTSDLKTFLPSNVLITGNDIIFFWVARMIMMTQYFTGKVPFRHVYINAMVRDAEGQKMSKSKGNTLDPLDLIDGIDLEALVKKSTASLLLPGQREKAEKYIRSHYGQGIPSFGTDALRFTFASLAPLSLTLNFDLNRCTGYRNFCNKLWNAARYVLMNTEGQDCASSPLPSGEGPGVRGTGAELTYSIADRWIRSRLGAAIAEVRARLDEYRFDLAAHALYEFAWHDYCDWYLELSKPALQSDSATPAQKLATRQTLVSVMEAYLRLLHPLMPFITEEIWTAVAPLAFPPSPSGRGARGEGKGVPNTIMLQPYPEAKEFPRDAAAERAIVPLKAAIEGPRQIRAQLNVPQSRAIPVYFTASEADDETSLSASLPLVTAVGNITQLHFPKADAAIPPSATAIVAGRTIRVPLADLIDDVGEEIARLTKRKAKAAQELAKCEGKLKNDNFVRNAPAEVVEQERQRVIDFKRELAQIDVQLEQLKNLK